MKSVYTVRQVNEYIKNMFAMDFMLNRIYIKGEVSNCKYHSSGHIYFSLKDESGTISCVMFAGSRSGLSFPMREGDQVVVLGSVSVYPRDGKYQVYANEIIKEGAGELHERFEAMKKELEEMGMFSENYKQPIPKFPKKIGVVTAPTGAAVQDIIQVVKRRNPYIQLVLYPALVQGEGAAASVAKGIAMLEEHVEPDVIIIGRGGGSMEDLWAFNERVVADAIFHCSIPIISAVGHETDTTIADFVSDLRAPTPSAAAELASYEFLAVKGAIDENSARLNRLMNHHIQQMRIKVEQSKRALAYLHPSNILKEKIQRLVDFEEKLSSLMQNNLNKSKHKLAVSVAKMQGLSPLEKLNQGYAYVVSGEGKTIRKIEDVSSGESISVAVTNGYIDATVNKVREELHNGNK